MRIQSGQHFRARLSTLRRMCLINKRSPSLMPSRGVDAFKQVWRLCRSQPRLRPIKPFEHSVYGLFVAVIGCVSPPAVTSNVNWEMAAVTLPLAVEFVIDPPASAIPTSPPSASPESIKVFVPSTGLSACESLIIEPAYFRPTSPRPASRRHSLTPRRSRRRIRSCPGCCPPFCPASPPR
jgi:hypothetical protein